MGRLSLKHSLYGALAVRLQIPHGRAVFVLKRDSLTEGGSSAALVLEPR